MEDEQIVALYWARDEAALTESDRKYGAYCQSIAWNVLRSREDADECVNDTWLHAWNAMPPEKPDILSAFLGRITRNLSLDRYRRRHAAKRGGGLEAIDLELDDCSAGTGLDSHLDAIAVAEAITTFLRASDQATRVIFLRRYWYADSIPEIAQRYHISESKVKSLLYRSRKRLRRYLEEEGIAV
ncbi:MAG: sigma-70 family RNA polymerase sigma factor [Clostridiales bacterium]|nr:sigma-70 family RNA polymerase sigma factor [Clostridiales bacterium]